MDSSAGGRKVKSGRRVEEPTNHHEGRGDVRGAKVTVIIVDEVYESTQLSFLISINNKNAPQIFLQDRELLHKKEQRKRRNQNHQHHIIIFALIKIGWV